MLKSLFAARTFIFVLAGTLGLAVSMLAQEISPTSHAFVSDKKIEYLEQLHKRAEEHILKNDFNGAIRLYQDILLEEPDDETAYTGMAQCQMVLGDFANAKISYSNALGINPDNETAVLGLEKIRDPDSMNVTEIQTAKIPAKIPQSQNTSSVTEIPSPIPATIPVRYPKEGAVKPLSAPLPLPSATQSLVRHPDDIHPGAKEAMAPYSVDIPAPLRELKREQQIQAALKNAGLYRGPIDGLVGPVTTSAIKKFQLRYDLDPDGKIGPKTWELLQPYLNPNDFKEDILKKGTSL